MTRKLTEIIFLLDRSGSMEGLESDTIGGFNAFVKQQSKFEGETTLTAVLFDDVYEILWDGINAIDGMLTEKEYYVRGTTALLDAIGKTILNVSHRFSDTNVEDKPEKLIFVITTDGMENASREFTYKKINNLIKQKQEENNWEFIFLGANIDAIQEANNLGVSKDNAFNFAATNVGVNEMYDQIGEVVTKKRQSKHRTKY